MKDALLVLSGGMDSVTLLYDRAADIALAVSFDYGSNHNDKEIPFARMHCEKLGIPHITIPLKFMHDYFTSSLLSGADAIPEGTCDDGKPLWRPCDLPGLPRRICEEHVGSDFSGYIRKHHD